MDFLLSEAEDLEDARWYVRKYKKATFYRFFAFMVRIRGAYDEETARYIWDKVRGND